MASAQGSSYIKSFRSSAATAAGRGRPNALAAIDFARIN